MNWAGKGWMDGSEVSDGTGRGIWRGKEKGVGRSMQWMEEWIEQGGE